jgi:hypothetical protein
LRAFADKLYPAVRTGKAASAATPAWRRMAGSHLFLSSIPSRCAAHVPAGTRSVAWRRHSSSAGRTSSMRSGCWYAAPVAWWLVQLADLIVALGCASPGILLRYLLSVSLLSLFPFILTPIRWFPWPRQQAHRRVLLVLERIAVPAAAAPAWPGRTHTDGSGSGSRHRLGGRHARVQRGLCVRPARAAGVHPAWVSGRRGRHARPTGPVCVHLSRLKMRILTVVWNQDPGSVSHVLLSERAVAGSAQPWRCACRGR